MNVEKKIPIIEKTKIWLSISLIMIAVAVGAVATFVATWFLYKDEQR